MPDWTIHEGEALDVLRTMPADSVDCVVTSPPYWRMRDYGHADQLGLEGLDEYIDRLAGIFDEVRRVLAPTGTCWVNLGDAYARNGGGRNQETGIGRRYIGTPGRSSPRLKPGDLAGVPWRFALEAQSRGWWLRSEIIWHKRNPLPESCRSRPAVHHEHLFLLTKSASAAYHYDPDAVRVPLAASTRAEFERGQSAARKRRNPVKLGPDGEPMGANRGSVWTIATTPAPSHLSGHFAMFPAEIPRLCILAGCPEGGVVLDPFNGAGTTGVVALQLGRRYVGIELVPAYVEMTRARIVADAPLLNATEEARADG